MNGESIWALRQIADRWDLAWKDPPLWFALEAKALLLTRIGNALVDCCDSADMIAICEDVRTLRRILKAGGLPDGDRRK